MNNKESETHPEVDLTHVIADSKAQLAVETPVKRGRGRPRKNRDETPAAQPVAPTPQASDPAPVASIVPMLVPALKAVSTIPASRYRVKELALSDDEATPLAQAVDQLITAYAPDLSAMSPKTAAWLSFGMVASSIFISKMQVYYEHSEKTIDAPGTGSEPAEKSPGPRIVPDESGFNKPQGGGITLQASEYFKRPT